MALSQAHTEFKRESGSRKEGPRVSTVDAAAQGVGQARRLRVLLLADDRHRAEVVRDHIFSIMDLSQHEVRIVNPIHHRKGLLLRWMTYDAILIHYSIATLVDYFLPAPVADVIRRFRGPKIQIIQDEYRWIDRMAERMADLGVNAVFSSLTSENIERVYHHDCLAGVAFYSGIPGYVSERLRHVESPPLSERAYDLVYRGRPLPIWLGKFSQEKVGIGLQAISMAARYGLKVDCKVKEEERVYGAAWDQLLMAGRAALATEGGATVFDFDGSVEMAVNEYSESHAEASDDEIWEKFVRPHDGRIVHKTITPRVLEAAMYGAALVMYPGNFRGVLKPWEHYIPLERDGSNEAEVAAFLKNNEELSAMIDRTRQRIVDDKHLHFEHYVAAIDAVASELSDTVSTARGLPFESHFPLGVTAYLGSEIVAGTIDRRMSALEVPGTLSAIYYERIQRLPKEIYGVALRMSKFLKRALSRGKRIGRKKTGSAKNSER